MALYVVCIVNVSVVTAWSQGTPLEDREPAAPMDIVRCIASARIIMPRSVVRLSAGRLGFSLADQVRCASCYKSATSGGQVVPKERIMCKAMVH